MPAEKKKYIISLCLIMLLTSCIFSCKHVAKVDFMSGDLSEVFATAKETHKKVFIIITAGSNQPF